MNSLLAPPGGPAALRAPWVQPGANYRTASQLSQATKSLVTVTAAPEKYDRVSTGHRCPTQMEDSEEILTEGLFTKRGASWERRLGLPTAGSGEQGQSGAQRRGAGRGAPNDGNSTETKQGREMPPPCCPLPHISSLCSPASAPLARLSWEPEDKGACGAAHKSSLPGPAGRDMQDVQPKTQGRGGNEVIGQEPLTGPVPLFHVN